MTTKTEEPNLEVGTSDPVAAPSTSKRKYMVQRAKIRVKVEGAELDFNYRDYPKYHDWCNLAELPAFQEYDPEKQYNDDSDEAQKFDRSFPISSVFEGVVNYDEIHKKALEMSNLSSEVTLQLLAECNYNLEELKPLLDMLVVPDPVPDYVKELVGANIYAERQSIKNYAASKFYFAKELKDCVDSKSLVDFYYKEKNKVKSNWKLKEEKTKKLSEEEELELQQLMRDADISIVKAKKPNIAEAPVKKPQSQSTRKRKTPSK